MPRLALGHLKLLDLSRQLPGPFCSTLLADLGMDVLVVTAPHDPFGTGIPFLGRNKRSMTLDLKTEAGRDVFRRLAAGADVVLEGFRASPRASASTTRRSRPRTRASSTARSRATGRTDPTATGWATTSTISATPAC